MKQTQRAVVQCNGVWRIYETEDRTFRIYHEFWRDGKKHKHVDQPKVAYQSLAEALEKLAKYIYHEEWKNRAHQMHTTQ